MPLPCQILEKSTTISYSREWFIASAFPKLGTSCGTHTVVYSDTSISTVRSIHAHYSYDIILRREIYSVESDYTVVFFAAGSRHTPGWNWVWKAYRSLSRKYRKNLKRLVRSSSPIPKAVPPLRRITSS